MLDAPPPDVAAALRDERPDFVVQSRHEGTRAARVGVTVAGALLLAGVLALGGLMLGGAGTMSVGEGAARRVVTGTERAVYALLLVATLGGIVLLVFGLVLRSLRAPGPWVAATARGLHVFRDGGHRLHPWRDFISVQRAGPDVVLHARMGVRLQHRKGSSLRHDSLSIVASDDPDRVCEACRARIDAALGEVAAGT